MSKQSSVEWLFEQVCNLDWKNLQGEKKIEIFQQAKEMHKEEIEDAYGEGYADGIHNTDVMYEDSIDYYTKTFNK